MKTCIIPVYNHEHAIAHVISKLKEYGIPCLLVNDGSSVACSQVLERQTRIGRRMNYDIDIVVRLYWQGVEAINIATAVTTLTMACHISGYGVIMS